MGPKKDPKNVVVEEPPKEVEPEPKPHTLVGYGRFEYLNGVVYEGNWKLIRGGKMKHGYGRLLFPFQPQSAAAQESYEGSWEEDKMQGYGTYSYPDGAVYSGEWVADKHQGRGRFTFANGTYYDGVWKDHKMHGTGFYVDHLGRKWEGEFRDGVYESRKQMELLKQKQAEQKPVEPVEPVKEQVKEVVKPKGK